MNKLKLDSLAGALYVLAAITSWGIYFPLAKLLLGKLSPVVFLILRLGLGGFVLLLLSLHLRQSLFLKRAEIFPVLLPGLVGIVLHQLVQVTGLRYTSASNTGWIMTIIPPVTGILGWCFLKERLTWRQILGLALAMAGVLLFVTRGHLNQITFLNHRGDLLALASVFTWSAYIIMTKSLLKNYHPLVISTLHMGLGFVFFLLLGVRDIMSQIPSLNLLDWLILVAIGVIPSGLAYFWWNMGLQRLSAVNTSVFLFIEAIVAWLASFFLLSEPFTLPMVLFAAVIVAGVYITQTK